MYENLFSGEYLGEVARCAAARQLLQIAWAVVRTGQPFDPISDQRNSTKHVADLVLG